METVFLLVPGTERPCPECGHVSVSWPLGVFGGLLYLTCPLCHVSVASVSAAVAPPDPCEGEGNWPVQHEGEHADDYNVRVEAAMFGEQDADLSED